MNEQNNKNEKWILAVSLLALSTIGNTHAESSADTIAQVFLSPVENGYVVDGVVPVTMKCVNFVPVSRNPTMPLNFVRTEFKNIWIAEYNVEGLSEHVISLDIACGPVNSYRRDIVVTNIASTDRTPARKMSNTILQHKAATNLKWDWGDAVMLFGLETWAQTNAADYLPVSIYISNYQKYYGSLQKPPAVNYSDRCPSALTAISTWQRFGQPESYKNLSRVTDYIKTADRNKLGALNHVGTSLFSLVVPPSIWVDSLMMYGLTAVRAGVALQDEGLLNFGLRQQIIFAEKLIDPDTGLYYHAWNVNRNKPYVLNPLSTQGTQWLRGNGWVGASLLLMLQELSAQQSMSAETVQLQAQLVVLTQQLAEASRPYMGKTRMFDTLMSSPGNGYEETSGTALMAYLYVQGANMGILDSSYGDLGRDIYRHLTARLMPKSEGHISMPLISGPTNPSTSFGYKLVQRGADYPYGQGAYLLLASAVNGGG